MLLRVRFHGRGGQGGKTASRILGDSAFNEGLNVQDSPLYGAERRGAPMTALVRISDQEIMERGYIFDPDVVVIMDETLLEDYAARPLRGVRTAGLVFINTHQPQLPSLKERSDLTVITLDLTKYSLDTIGRPFLSAASAAAAARLVGVISEDSLLRAVRTELEEIGISGSTLENNIELARRVYRLLTPREVKTRERPVKGRVVPVEVLLEENGIEDITSPGNSRERRTGDWRIFTPKIDYEKCTRCMVCYAYCPESAVSIGNEGEVVIDYENCKGCMICMRECPTKAITAERMVTVE
jgi:pyruvate ferredoxin oxidoreductase gamma subunit